MITWKRRQRSSFPNIEPHSITTASLTATACTKVLVDFSFKHKFIYIMGPQMSFLNLKELAKKSSNL